MANPRFPLYIPSKGRANSRLTSKALDKMKVPYHIVVERSEFDQYASVMDEKKILILDDSYKESYDKCGNLGAEVSPGPGAARNFIWDHSIAQGYDWHWIMDDNINGFCRLNKNKKINVDDGTIFKCMEDFCLRYENVGMAGPHYRFFADQRAKRPPFTLNSRVYSCNLIRNDLPLRWRGRYNEDTILSLDMLKSGWCTILFNAFLQNKMATQTVKGGNTDEFYAKEGTYPKSKMLVDLHPDVSRIAHRYGRWHHHVDYSVFKSLKLKKKPGLKIKQGVNNYGMILKHLAEGHAKAKKDGKENRQTKNKV